MKEKSNFVLEACKWYVVKWTKKRHFEPLSDFPGWPFRMLLRYFPCQGINVFKNVFFISIRNRHNFKQIENHLDNSWNRVFSIKYSFIGSWHDENNTILPSAVILTGPVAAGRERYLQTDGPTDVRTNLATDTLS